jgi:hypothetical protein
VSHIDGIVRGVLGAAAGTACMSVLRMAARRAGLIDLTPPQATKSHLARWTRQPATPAGHHLMDAGIHLAVGLGGGAVYGAFLGDRRRPRLLGGLLFGVGLWAIAFGVLAPWLGIGRSPRKATGAENAVNLTAHLIYGTATALVAGELAEQAHGLGAAARRWRARIG